MTGNGTNQWAAAKGTPTPRPLELPAVPQHPLADSAKARAWADGAPCAGAELDLAVAPIASGSLVHCGSAGPSGRLPSSTLPGSPRALRAPMAELRPSVAPGPAAPPAPGPSASPAFASLFPPGLHAIYGECRRLYPDQPNPLQVTAIVKYWYALGLGGTGAAGTASSAGHEVVCSSGRKKTVKGLGSRELPDAGDGVKTEVGSGDKGLTDPLSSEGLTGTGGTGSRGCEQGRRGDV